jgi:glycyl-tRNA synthetase beta chain
MQSTVQKKVKGPAIKASFDADGKPQVAAVKFAEKHGLKVEELEREDDKLVANLTIEGKPSSGVLQEIVPQAIMALSGERLMRWGDSELKFSRPIRWIVSILDKDELPVQLDGIKSGRDTFGNRVLAPEKLSITDPNQYVDSLRKAKVLVDPAERRQLIEKQVREAAEKLAGKPRQLSGSLLDEVTNILEWPCAVVGEYGEEYLELPDTLIETVMVHHQRYFPVEKAESTGVAQKLLPYFITVANNDRKEAHDFIKKGNERVIKARLADGRFFFFDDQKKKLLDRKSDLDELTFQEGLGSFLKKTERLCLAAKHLTSALMLEPKYFVCIERSLMLCKLDLVSNLVRELPELQGHVGAWYAAREGETLEVVEAISSHYKPRHPEDSIPPDTVGRFAAFLDKLDTLVGLFALGRRPSGSSDPYALRRQCYGMIDILMEGLNDYHINVSEMMAFFMDQIRPMLVNKKNFDAAKALTDLSEFLVQRIRTKLLDAGIHREVIEAVCSSGKVLSDIPDAVTRCRALEDLIKADPQLALIRAGVRVGKILSDDDKELKMNPSLFESDAEKDLYNTFVDKVQSKWPESKFLHALTADDYKELVSLLPTLERPIQAFFDNVLVEDPDKAKRDNRHSLLHAIYKYFSAIGDFRYLKPLLP